MKQNLIKSMMLLATMLLLAITFTACNSEDDLPKPKKDEVENKDGAQKKDETKKIEGVMPAKVVIELYQGHLHGFPHFHQNALPDSCKYMGSPQKFIYNMVDGQWVADKSNPKNLYALSSNVYQNDLAACYYAITLTYFDKDGNNINGKFIEKGQDQKYQHFFVVKDLKALSDFDAALDNPKKHEFVRYDYVDPTPWNKTMHFDEAKSTGLENPLGFKGMLSFGYGRHTCTLNIMLMEAKNGKGKHTHKTVIKDSIYKYDKEYDAPDFTPTEEQLKNEAWYPTISIPVVVHIDRKELETDVDDWDKAKELPMAQLPASLQRSMKTLMSVFGISEKKAFNEFYFNEEGTRPNHDSSSFWF